MSHKPQIHNLGPADAPNKFGLSNGAGIQEYSLLNSGDYSVALNVVSNNPMSYADSFPIAAPAITPTPPAAPISPANNATLYRKYTDRFRVWRRVSGVWAHVFDVPRVKHVELITVYRIEDPVTAAIAAKGQFFVVPAYMNGWTLEEVNFLADNGAGTVDCDVLQNGGVVITQVGVNIVNSVAAAAIVIATGDKFSVRPYNPVGALNGLTTTFVFNPNY